MDGDRLDDKILPEHHRGSMPLSQRAKNDLLAAAEAAISGEHKQFLVHDEDELTDAQALLAHMGHTEIDVDSRVTVGRGSVLLYLASATK